MTEHGTPSFVRSLASGRLDPEFQRHAPVRGAAERRAGDTVIAGMTDLLKTHLDPDLLDSTGELPPAFLDAVRAHGLFKLRGGPEVDGLGLTAYEAFRVLEAAARHSVAAGQLIAIPNAVGAAALVPALPPGPVRDFVTRRVAQGAVSGFGVTEPAGQNNTWPAMTATVAPDGDGVVLHGEKLFIGNGDIADLLAVAATETVDGERWLCVAFIDTADCPGFRVTSAIEFLGSKGLPNAALRLDGVHVPADRLLRGAPGDPRMSAPIRSVLLDGQLYFTAAPAMAIARQCLEWTEAFIQQRAIDGRGLGTYRHIQHLASATRAEVHAMESVLERALVGAGPDERWFERMAAKNFTVKTAWRIVDRTVSLFGGAGIETVGSKHRRGADPVPLERAFRDARGLRIAGNVDFQLDNQLGRRLFTEVFGSPGDEAASTPWSGHLADSAADLRRLHEQCHELIRAHGGTDRVLDDEDAVILTARIASELLAVSTVLARREHDPAAGSADLTDVYCAAGRHRLSALHQRLDAQVRAASAVPSRPYDIQRSTGSTS